MEPIKFIAQLDSVRTTKDGGGKITLEFGLDSLEAIHKLQLLTKSGDMSLALAIMPFQDEFKSPVEF